MTNPIDTTRLQEWAIDTVDCDEAIDRIEELEAERAEGMAAAVYLARSLHRRFYCTEAPQWEPLEDIAGVVSQVDNMAAGMADRIDALQVKLAALSKRHEKALQQGAENRTKLATAEEFLRATIRYAGSGGDDFLADKARVTLAALKGQGDD